MSKKHEVVKEEKKVGVWEAIHAMNLKINTEVKALKDKHAAELADRDNTIEILTETVDGLVSQVEALSKELNDLEMPETIDTTAYATRIDLDRYDALLDDFQDTYITVQDLSPVRDAIQELRDDAEKTTADLNSQFGPIRTELDALSNDLSNTIDDIANLRGYTNTIEDTANVTARAVDNQERRITELYDWIAAFDDVRASITQEIADVHDQIAGAIKKVSDKVTTEIGRIEDVINGIDDQIAGIQVNFMDKIEGFTDFVTRSIEDERVRTTETIEGAVNPFNDTQNEAIQALTALRVEIHERLDDLNNKFAETVCSLPKTLMINSDGVLIGIDSKGTVNPIGSVHELKKTTSQAEDNRAKFTKWFESQPENAKIDVEAKAKEHGVTIQTIYRWMRKSDKST